MTPNNNLFREEKHEKKVNQQISIARIYTKSSTFESVSLTRDLIENPPSPVIEVQAQVGVSKREGQTYEAVLSLQLKGKDNGNLLWHIQLQQAGLYTLEGFNEEQANNVLNGYCINLLYPYACAVATTMVVNGGFPPIYLGPLNFDALYQEQQKKGTGTSQTQPGSAKYQ